MALIGCVQIPEFAIAVARRDNPTLADSPLVLYGEGRQRATVAAASAETGIRPGVSLRQALVRCPHAIVRPAAPDRTQQVLAALIHLLHTFSPRVAAHSLSDDAQIELDLGRSTFAETIVLTQRITEQIQASLQLVPALGVAATRFVAQRAADVAGTGATVIVPAGAERTFLAPQPVETFPVDGETIQRLRLLGLRTIGDLAHLPLDALQAQFGGTGRRLYQLARGSNDAVPIAASAVAPTLERRGRFAGPLTNRTLLDTAIERLAARLTAQLITNGWAARTIVLTFRLEDGAPWIGTQTLRTPTTDPALLTQAFLNLSHTANLESGVETITLHINDLVRTVVTQRELFAPAAGQQQELDGALERLHTRYASSFVRAQLDDPTAHLPEQRMRFAPWEPR
jgi:DNA polymerase IV